MSSPHAAVAPVSIRRYQQEQFTDAPDLVVVEEPLEIRLGFGPENARDQKSISVTMRTPGHDFDLALGFLFSEGIVERPTDIHSVNYCQNVEKPEEAFNTVKVELAPQVKIDFAKLERHFYTTSSCGVCGKSSIEAVRGNCPAPMIATAGWIPAELIYHIAENLLGNQAVFNRTGGLHAAALFNRQGEMLVLREDVGRHNAVDKVIGGLFMQGQIPLSECLLWVSGRAGFELVQKAVMAGIPLMASVGAPTSLSVQLAVDSGLTLAGFVREGRFNLYSHPERLAP